jgi:hypothetical protein
VYRRRRGDWTKASMMRHIWNLFAKAGSLWVAWVKEYLLKGKCFWQIRIPQECSWCWRKLLKLRDIARQFCSLRLGVERTFSYDWIIGIQMGCCLKDMVLGLSMKQGVSYMLS